MRLSRRSFVGGAVATGAIGLSGRLARGADNPWADRPIRLIVPTAAGGSYDIVARQFAEIAAARIGRSIVVENQLPAVAAHRALSQAKPDGHTLIMTGGGYTTGAAIDTNLPYDPYNGLMFITTFCTHPMVYSVRHESPFKTFQDVIDAAKANPGKLKYPILGTGSVHRFLGAWVDIAAGTKMVAVPYRGAAQSITDVLAGRIDIMLEPSTSGFPRIRQGQVRPLALSSPGKYAMMPNVPAISDTLPGVVAMSWIGLAGPPGLPQPVVDRLLEETRHTLSQPKVIASYEEAGDVTTPDSNPAQMKKLIVDEIATWNGIIDKAGIQRDKAS